MFVYFVSLIPLLTYAFDKNLTKIFSVLAIITLCLFSGLRNHVGFDYQTYSIYFDEIFRGNDVYFEKGFHLLVEFLGYLWPESQFVFFIVSLITTLFFYFAIKKYSLSYPLSLFIFASAPFLFMATFNQIRQFLVCALFIYFVDLIIKKGKLKLILWIALLSLFHKTAFLYLPLILFGGKRYSIIYYAIGLFLIAYLSKYASVLVQLLGFSSVYLMDSSSSSDAVGINFFLFVVIFIIFFMFLAKNNEDKNNNINNVFLNMVYCCVCILIVPGFVSGIDPTEIIRLLGLFSISLCFVFPYIISKFKSESFFKMCALFSVFLIFSTYYIITLYFNGERYMLIPYSIW